VGSFANGFSRVHYFVNSVPTDMCLVPSPSLVRAEGACCKAEANTLLRTVPRTGYMFFSLGAPQEHFSG
jgi:hypothetical protein